MTWAPTTSGWAMADMALSIRDAGPADFPQVERLIRMDLQYHAEHRPDLFHADGFGYGWEEFERLLADPGRIALLAEVDGETAGLCFGKVEDTPDNTVLKPVRIGAVEDLAVFPAFRRRGVARTLLEEAKARAGALGAGGLRLRVWQFNQGAAALYRSLGFEPQWSELEADLREQ